MAGGLSGILLVDKPEGWTSHDVVSKLRRLTGQRRIGHSGTLDPMATGLLVVFLGRATRAVEFAEADSKQYRAALRLGVTTDTLDITGAVTGGSGTVPTVEELLAVLPRFRGEIQQLPPMYSAIRQNGRRLYEIAREGGEVERKSRAVTISALELVGRAENGDYLLDISCTKGTYIRTLCADIGETLGCGGCMSALRRNSAGMFSIENAQTMETLQRDGAERYMLPVDSLFAEHPECTATEREEEKIRVGARYKTALSDGVYRVYAASGEFLMLGKAQGGVMTTIKSFFEV